MLDHKLSMNNYFDVPKILGLRIQCKNYRGCSNPLDTFVQVFLLPPENLQRQ